MALGCSLLRWEHYRRWVAVLAALILISTNVGLIAGNLAAIGSGFALITGISWVWFVIPAALFLWYITVFSNFNFVKKVFLVMCGAFITYLITAFASGADWQTNFFLAVTALVLIASSVLFFYGLASGQAGS